MKIKAICQGSLAAIASAILSYSALISPGDLLSAAHTETAARRMVFKFNYMVRAAGRARAFDNCGRYCVPKGLHTLTADGYK